MKIFQPMELTLFTNTPIANFALFEIEVNALRRRLTSTVVVLTAGENERYSKTIGQSHLEIDRGPSIGKVGNYASSLSNSFKNCGRYRMLRLNPVYS